MIKDFNILKFIRDLLKFSPRQGINEIKTADFIIDVLKNNNIPFLIQSFKTTIPLIENSKLVVDGRQLPCEGCSFVGGEIKDKDSLVSSLISSQLLKDKANINFNPKCPGISRSNFYFQPALSIKRNDVKKIIQAKTIKGSLKVTPQPFILRNILVGNIKNPANIIFAHFDSIATGATDNASGVAAITQTILRAPQKLKKSLFVFSGNEELSYDFPVYWGHGFREFEKKYYKLMSLAKKIFVVDCVGNGLTVIDQDLQIMPLAFPIKNITKWQKKIYLVSGNIEKLMSVYHSSLDGLDQLQEKWLRRSAQKLISNL